MVWATCPKGNRSPMRRLVCLACRDRVVLRGDAVSCACERSSARKVDDGGAYHGPAVIAIAVNVHEPEHRAMGERLIEVPDDERSRRAQVEPLL